MRILHLTDHYPPVVGGIESHVANLARRQALAGHDVTVLTSTPGPVGGPGHLSGGPVEVVRVRSLAAGVRVGAGDVDLVHAHVSVVAPFTAPLVGVLARRGLPAVVTVHSLWTGMGPLPAVAAALCGMRSAPLVWTSVSRVAAQGLRRRLPAGTPVLVIPNAVDAPARTETRPGGNVVQVVSTMRLAHRKRPLELLRVLDRVTATTSRPVQLTVVGDGPLRQGFERLARRRHLSGRVHVTGELSPAGVLARLAEADVYVAPAVLESFGLAALEARAVGLPVVGRLGTGLADFIEDGVNGLLRADDSGLAAALTHLVDDESLRRRISEHNRTVQHGLSWRRSLEAHDGVYRLARGTHPERVVTR